MMAITSSMLRHVGASFASTSSRGAHAPVFRFSPSSLFGPPKPSHVAAPGRRFVESLADPTKELVWELFSVLGLSETRFSETVHRVIKKFVVEHLLPAIAGSGLKFWAEVVST